MNPKQFLNEGWSFRLIPNTPVNTFDKNVKSLLKKSYPAQVPGTIHTDLLANRLIEEPFFADNEDKLQWISDQDWEYTTTFELSEDIDLKKPVELVFAGLDTIADIFLNGKKLGSSVSMFHSYRFSVASQLCKGKNELTVLFHSPDAWAKREEKKYGPLAVALRPERAYIRKAQYSFGWDWGPTFLTSGIWKYVWLENLITPSISDINFITKSLSGESAKCRIETTFSQELKAGQIIKLELEFADTEVFSQEFKVGKTRTVAYDFTITDPKIWNPNGSGEQNLYIITVTLLDDDNAIAIGTKRVGIRTVELQLSDKDGKTFRFIVNGKPVYMKGVDWIPSHSFLTNVTPDVYHTLLEKAKFGNMNMVRVWGGGIYEQDLFYDLCDELGLLVWQDFMFACGAYPEHAAFVAEVKKEVEENVTRLRSHPCMAIWCGNNENEWIWHQQFNNSYKNMPGHVLFSKHIPEVVKRLAPNQPYWVSSPFGEGNDPNSMESGNRHQWDIWSRWIDYEKVTEDVSRFVTEFGFQGPANAGTLEAVIPAAERNIHSRLFEFHNKQVEGNERVIKFLAGHLPLHTEWNDFIYLAQLNQGFALKTCLEHWRGNSPMTNGSLIWQLNDCWPVTSWAIIDSSLTPKLSYHFVRRAFAPINISFRKRHGSNEIISANSTGEPVKALLEVVSFSQGAASKKILTKKVKLEATESQVLTKIASGPREDILVATLYGEAGEIISRNYVTSLPWKYLKLPEAKLRADVSEKDGETRVTIHAGNIAFFIDPEMGNTEFPDRGFILLPGESRTFIFNTIIKASQVKLTCLNDYLKGN